MSLNLHILQHSLGLDQYGRGNSYRNRYIIGPDGDGFEDCQRLVSEGLMLDLGPQSMCSGMHCFTVTEAGKKYVADNSPKPPKISRSKQRYLDYLEVGDCFESFGHYLKYKAREARAS